jgi:hypothetical protein
MRAAGIGVSHACVWLWQWCPVWLAVCVCMLCGCLSQHSSYVGHPPRLLLLSLLGVYHAAVHIDSMHRRSVSCSVEVSCAALAIASNQQPQRGPLCLNAAVFVALLQD